MFTHVTTIGIKVQNIFIDQEIPHTLPFSVQQPFPPEISIFVNFISIAQFCLFLNFMYIELYNMHSFFVAFFNQHTSCCVSVVHCFLLLSTIPLHDRATNFLCILSVILFIGFSKSLTSLSSILHCFPSSRCPLYCSSITCTIKCKLHNVAYNGLTAAIPECLELSE